MKQIEVRVVIKLYRNAKGELQTYAEGANDVDLPNIKDWIETVGGEAGHGPALAWYETMITITPPDHVEALKVDTVSVVRVDDLQNSYLSKSSREAELLGLIADCEGYENIDQLIEDVTLRSVHPGICTDEECEAVTSRIEPDQDEGWCHDCDQNTVKSVGILSGLI